MTSRGSAAVLIVAALKCSAAWVTVSHPFASHLNQQHSLRSSLVLSLQPRNKLPRKSRGCRGVACYSTSDASSSHRIEQSQAETDRRARRASVFAVLAATFLNLLGFTMAGPITPALGQHFKLALGPSFGSLTSAFPVGMLLGHAVWPQLSDRVGRKPVIAVSLLGLCINTFRKWHPQHRHRRIRAICD